MELLQCIENRLSCTWKRERQTPSERVRRETRKRRIWLSHLSEPEEVLRDLSGDS